MPKVGTKSVLIFGTEYVPNFGTYSVPKFGTDLVPKLGTEDTRTGGHGGWRTLRGALSTVGRWRRRAVP